MSDSFEKNPLEKTAPAQWFGADGDVVRAELRFGADGIVHARNAADERRAVPLSAVSVSPRLANIPRRIEFPDGVVLAVADNDFVDAALRRAGRMRGSRAIHIFESRLAWAAAILAAAILAGWLAVAQGLPLAGKVVAASVSQETLGALSAEALDALASRGLLAESELSATEKARAQKLFSELAARFADDDADYRLQIRRMRFGGTDFPNAFALPDGMIVLSDRLAELADDDELTAVFAHEIGHARARHGVRMAAQAAGAAGLGALIFGDITGALGAALVSAGHSRAHEREADCFAYRVLSDIGIDWRNLGAVLRKMETELKLAPPIAQSGDADDFVSDGFDSDGFDSNDSDSDSVAEKNSVAEKKSDVEKSRADAVVEAGLAGMMNFLATHPPTEARANPKEHCA